MMNEKLVYVKKLVQQPTKSKKHLGSAGRRLHKIISNKKLIHKKVGGKWKTKKVKRWLW